MAVSWSPYRLIAPAGPGGKLNVFIFHRVRAACDPLFPGEVDRPAFAARLAFLRRWFNLLPLDEALRRLDDQTLPPAAASLTFDDGYADNLTVATPLLQRYGVPATVFVATGYLDGGRMWNDTVIEAVRASRGAALDLRDEGVGLFPVGTVEEKRRAIDALLPALKYRPAPERQRLADRIAAGAGCRLPADLMLTGEQLRELSRAGIGIGAHTVTHPILARADAAAAADEIAGSKRALESLLQADVALFAYPNGVPGKDYDAAHVAMVRRAGFRAAFSTAAGIATVRSPRFELPRFTPWGRTAMFALRMARHLARAGDLRVAADAPPR